MLRRHRDRALDTAPGIVRQRTPLTLRYGIASVAPAVSMFIVLSLVNGRARMRDQPAGGTARVKAQDTIDRDT